MHTKKAKQIERCYKPKKNCNENDKQKETTKKSQWWEIEKIGFNITLAKTKKTKAHTK